MPKKRFILPEDCIPLKPSLACWINGSPTINHPFPPFYLTLFLVAYKGGGGGGVGIKLFGNMK
mgnify:CR=1 FL=1